MSCVGLDCRTQEKIIYILAELTLGERFFQTGKKYVVVFGFSKIFSGYLYSRVV